MISHPIKSIGGILQRGGQAIADNPGSLTGALSDFAVKPLVEQGVNDYQSGGATKAILHGAGTGIGMWATGELGGVAMKPAASLASSALKAIGRGGLEVGNNVLGARGPKPFKYGANPARGAYEEGILPALSRHSAAMKLDAAIPNVGQRISDKVMAGGNVPLPDIARSINTPVNEARSVIEGPGGGNRSVEPIEALRSSMERRARGASRPIYGPDAGTPFSPAEAHAAITRPGRLALPAPSEDIPLANSPDVEGRLSKPITLNQPERPMPLTLPAPRNVSAEIPLVEHPGVDPSMSPMAFPAERMPQRNISGFGTDSRTAGNLGRNYRELGQTTTSVPPRLTREAYLSGSEHPELSGRIPVSEGVLRRFEEPTNAPVEGMGPGQFVGEIPGERGGLGQPQGVLRRAPQYPESEQPSPLSNLTHPYATALDLWRTIQNLDKNTRFNLDPEVEGVNEVRRDMRGGLRGNLEDAVPGLKPETQRYADLKSGEESLGRVLHGGMSLRKMMDLPMTAAESIVGRGMYKAGKMAPAAAASAPVGRAAGLANYLRNKDKDQQ
jgi:hypothetical protein